MIDILHRNQITDLLPKNSIGCELGVFEGDFSEQLISSNKFDKLYLVDLFSGPAWNFGKHYPDAAVLYDSVKNRFQDKQEVYVIKQDSVSFLKSSELKFDFIYIDTIHSYEYLSQELAEAYNLIKSNGYICGHDYCTEFGGVIQAVKEFSEKYQYEVSSTKESGYPSFIIHIKD